MSERNDVPRDLERGGDVGEGSHGAFSGEREREPHGSDDRLALRGRSTGSEEAPFLDELAAERAIDAAEGGTRDADR
jgi:hypothetical protein